MHSWGYLCRNMVFVLIVVWLIVVITGFGFTGRLFDNAACKHLLAYLPVIIGKFKPCSLAQSTAIW